MQQLYELELETSTPYGKDPERDLEALFEQCRKSIVNPDENLIREAFYFAVNGHTGVFRSSGEPYYIHPLKVAISLMTEFNVKDNASIAAALLHDTVEDVELVTYETIQEKFGEEIAHIVDGVTHIKGAKTRQMDRAATYGKLFMALIRDIRVIFIKLADRLDNMRTLHYLPLYKQKAIGHETLNFYTPFAQRLGLIRIKRVLEDLALYFTDRDAFDAIRPALEDKRKDFLDYIKNFYDQLTMRLNEKNVDHVLTIEHKHVYEIYKMMEQGKTLGEIDNFYSMVITLKTNDYAECYRTYGIIANVFGPVSSLNDYIATPKINFYRALHSTHFGPGRKLVEVIIRTEEMDKIAEGGIAALFPLRESNRALDFNEEDTEDWLKWMLDIIEDGDEDAIQKIWGSIRMNLYEDEIIVHTAERESIRLPNGACPIDLAFGINDEIGYHCISSKVNGNVKSLDYELKNYDLVELITSPNSKPSPEWQDYVVTHKAIARLYEYFKKYKTDEIKPKQEKAAQIVKFRIIGEDKPGMLNEITQAIGKLNIMRINLYSTTDSAFEGAFTLSVRDTEHLNTLFSRLLSIKGLRGVERLDEPE